VADRIRAVLLDFGDTLSNQATEARDDDGTLIGVELVQGAKALVEELKARGYPLALVADGKVEDARKVLAQHGLDSRFDAVVISEALGTHKPHPHTFLRALAELGLGEDDASDVVMVGNRLERDIKGARELGITAVWIDWSPRYDKRPREPAAVPDHRIEHPLELLDVLDRLERGSQGAMGDAAEDGIVARSGTFAIGGDLPVHRLGFGAMRLTGRGIWGEPEDPEECRRVLRRAVELGVTLIDTADSYGPEVSERLIAEALHPYPEDLVIATKAGLERSGPGRWHRNGRPEHIRAACEGSLERLKLERIDVYQLHRIDPHVPIEDSLGAMLELRDEGKVRHIGVSEVGFSELERARALAPIVSVQNRFNVTDRSADDVLEACERDGLGFIPWFPLETGELTRPGGPLAEAADRHGATPAQIALAWLLHRSPVMLPIPGTSSVAHLEENVAAAEIELSLEEVEEIEQAVGAS
jgi:pyridoxine 4-dehydrogenase